MTSFEECILGPVGPAAKEVQRIVRQEVSLMAPGVTVSTNTLGGRLYPETEGETAAKVRKRLFSLLQVLAKNELSDCAHKGPLVKRRFGEVRPWLWHRSDGSAPAPRCCTKCGQPLPKKES